MPLTQQAPPRPTTKRRTTGVLFLYHRPYLISRIGDASNVNENIAAFQRHSRYPVWTVNTDLGPPPGIDEVEFDAIVVHYSCFVHGTTDYHVAGFEHLLRSGAYKIATFQDEHHWTAKRFGFLNEYEINCVFTMLEPPYGEQVYGERTKATKVVSNLPGYVSPELLDEARRFAKPESKRSIDIGYRGRQIAPYMGQGSQEKHEIGARFAKAAAGSGLRLDIKLGEGERLYGDDWYEFMADCVGTLGVESGVSCFDIEDEVMQEYTRLSADGHFVTIDELTTLERWDWKIPYRTISPRHFEASALRVTQILYEGHYSGVMEPMRHYIPLKKDFSNFDEVVERFRDPDLRRELTENAYHDLIASGDYGYERLVDSFDEVLSEAGIPTETSPAELARVERALHWPLAKRLRRWQIANVNWLYTYHRVFFWLVWTPVLVLSAPRRLFRRLRGRD